MITLASEASTKAPTERHLPPSSTLAKPFSPGDRRKVLSSSAASELPTTVKPTLHLPVLAKKE